MVSWQGKPQRLALPVEPPELRAGTGRHAGGGPKVCRGRTALRLHPLSRPGLLLLRRLPAAVRGRSGRAVAHWPKDCVSRRPAGRSMPIGAAGRSRGWWRPCTRRPSKFGPGIKISAAVFGGYPDCRRAVAQDWAPWARRATSISSARWTTAKATCRLRPGGEPNAAGRRQGSPLSGIGATATQSTLPADRVAAQVEVARRLGAGGFTIFNFDEHTADAVIPGLGLGVGAQHAVPPHRQP